MPFPLKDIELQFEDSIIEKAEKLLQNGALQDLKELDRNFWEAKIIIENKSNEEYEVEAQISPSKVKDYSCDCETFLKDKFCSHIIAVLLRIRELQKAKEALREEKKKNQGIPGLAKLNTAHLLKSIEEEELKAFVRSYARMNKEFSLSLKAKFAPNIQHMDLDLKYSQIVSATVKTACPANNKINARGLRLILLIGHQLFGHAQDAMVLRHFSESFAIQKSLLVEILPCLRKIQPNKDDLISLINQIILAFKELNKKGEAPALRKEIWSFLFEETNRAAYIKYGFDNALLEVLIELAVEKHQQEDLIEVLDEMIFYSESKPNQQVNYLLSKIVLIEKAGLKKSLKELLENNLDKPKILLEAIRIADEKGEVRRMKQLADLGNKKFAGTKYMPFFSETLLQVAIQESDLNQISKLAKLRLLQTYHLDYFRLLKKSGADYDPAKIIKSIQQKVYSLEQRDLVAAIYAQEKDFENLIAYIKRIRSFDLLLRYDTFFLKNDKMADARELYRFLIFNYLEHHIGPKAAIKTREIVRHLYQIKEEKFANKVIKQIQEEHSTRHSLMDELDLFYIAG